MGGDDRKARGREAEQAANDYLTALGYTILKRNWRCRSGELDLIAKDGDTIVIVEVRSRSHRAAAFGTPAESITPRKIKQVRDTAAVYFHQTGQTLANVRFDVIAVTYSPGEQPKVEHIKNAF
ncbi:YraN family protein [Paenibacillus sp. TH7-28]